MGGNDLKTHILLSTEILVHTILHLVIPFVYLKSVVSL